MAAEAEAAAAAVVARVRALPSPPPPGLEAPLEPGAALRLLCTPSGPRLALLEWLCCRVNPPLAKRLGELRDGPEEARLRELVALVEELALSEAEDTALVEGTAPPEQQLGFIRDLLDAVPSAQERREGARSGILLRGSALLQEILETPEGRAALNPPPLSPGPGTPPGPPPPRTEGLELERELGETRRHLEMVEAKSPELGGPPGPAPPLLPVGQALASLASAFVRTGLGVAQPHTGGAAPPELSPCGPMAPPVRHRLRHLQQVLEATTLLSDLAMEEGGGWRHAMEAQLAALQQRFKGSLQQ